MMSASSACAFRPKQARAVASGRLIVRLLRLNAAETADFSQQGAVATPQFVAARQPGESGGKNELPKIPASALLASPAGWSM